jgi:hypothetical protein
VVLFSRLPASWAIFVESCAHGLLADVATQIAWRAMGSLSNQARDREDSSGSRTTCQGVVNRPPRSIRAPVKWVLKAPNMTRDTRVTATETCSADWASAKTVYELNGMRPPTKQAVPILGALPERFHDRVAFHCGQSVTARDAAHVLPFYIRHLHDFPYLSQLLVEVMFRGAAGCEKATQTHGNGAICDFRQARGDDHAGFGNRTGQARGKREGNGQAVGHADDCVSDYLARGKVLCGMAISDPRSTR